MYENLWMYMYNLARWVETLLVRKIRLDWICFSCFRGCGTGKILFTGMKNTSLSKLVRLGIYVKLANFFLEIKKCILLY